MVAMLDIEGKIAALGLAMVLSLALLQTAMMHLLPLRFRLKSLLIVTAFAAVILVLLRFAFG